MPTVTSPLKWLRTALLLILGLPTAAAFAQGASDGPSSDRGSQAPILVSGGDAHLADQIAKSAVARGRQVDSRRLLNARAAGKSFEQALTDLGMESSAATSLVRSFTSRLQLFGFDPARLPPPIAYPPRDASGEYELFVGFESRFTPSPSLNQHRAPSYLWFALSPRLAAEIDFDVAKSIGSKGDRTTGNGDTYLSLKPVLVHQSRDGLPKLTATYSVKLPTAETTLGSGEVDHGLALEATRLFGAQYQHLILASLSSDWVGENNDSGYAQSTSAFGRLRVRLPRQLFSRYAVELETDLAWSDLTSSVGFARQAIRIRLPHQMKVRTGFRLGLGSGVSNGFYFDFRIGGKWKS